jgi:hypothetical protein
MRLAQTLAHTQFDGCHYAFHVGGEIALHNPTEVARVGGQYVGHQSPFVFAEVDYFAVLVVVYEATHQVNIVVLR